MIKIVTAPPYRAARASSSLALAPWEFHGSCLRHTLYRGIRLITPDGTSLLSRRSQPLVQAPNYYLFIQANLLSKRL